MKMEIFRIFAKFAYILGSAFMFLALLEVLYGLPVDFNFKLGLLMLIIGLLFDIRRELENIADKIPDK